jgi:hypothetical protein
MLAIRVRDSEPGAGAKTRLTKTKSVVEHWLATRVRDSEPGAGAKTRLTKTTPDAIRPACQQSSYDCSSLT